VLLIACGASKSAAKISTKFISSMMKELQAKRTELPPPWRRAIVWAM